MLLINQHILLLLFAVTVASSRSFSSDLLAAHTAPINQIANVTYGTEIENQGSLTSIFSPRMDFEQWKPLTGRGDPLRNDPTYDYEPPVLERVHYWADETRLEREHYPERKSEVLMLGVSSRKPSVTSRQPPLPPRRHVHRPQPNKYEDFTYKLSEHYPMTILVPPPPPPPGHQAPLFIISDDKPPINNKVPPQTKPNSPPQILIPDSTIGPEHITSSYALQESNLIYQSSTTIQNWIRDANDTKILDNAVSSDYAGWGPTTPVDDNDSANETHNLILNDHAEFPRHPYSFYKPMLSESPPPPKLAFNPSVVSTFVPTALPPTTSVPPTMAFTKITWPTERSTEMLEYTTETPQETTTEKRSTAAFRPTPIPTTVTKLETSVFDMLGPMMSMPMVNGPERPEDNLYAHASETVHIFDEHKPEDVEIETMQTMQPPPVKPVDSIKTAQKQQFHVNSQDKNKKPAIYTHGPYLHNRFTTPIPTTIEEFSENVKQTTETPTVPMYLIIQGHSKVKTYGSKPKVPDSKETVNNEISKPLETNEVKHLHPIVKKSAKKLDLTDSVRKNNAKSLKTLIDSGVGSIEIQETDLGIKYDVSDGSDVPIEIYRKGIVDNDENDYSNPKKTGKELRTKRQIDLEDLLPFDEETIEEYVYNFLEGKKNDTGITGLIAQAVTSDAAQAVDELEDEDDSEQEEER
nr:zonadhesin [Helicoverpa armigera]